MPSRPTTHRLAVACATLAVAITFAGCGGPPAASTDDDVTPSVSSTVPPAPADLLTGDHVATAFTEIADRTLSQVSITSTRIDVAFTDGSGAVFHEDVWQFFDGDQESLAADPPAGGGWTTAEWDAHQVPDLVAAASLTCADVEITVLKAAFEPNARVSCAGEAGDTAAYFDAAGTQILDLDLTTAEGLDTALSDVTANAEGEVLFLDIETSTSPALVAATFTHADAPITVARTATSDHGFPLAIVLTRTFDDTTVPFDLARVDGTKLLAALAEAAELDPTSNHASYTMRVFEEANGHIVANVAFTGAGTLPLTFTVVVDD